MEILFYYYFLQVIEADAAPLQPAEPVALRQIFPIFPSDLRSGSDEIVFARPEQVSKISINQLTLAQAKASEQKSTWNYFKKYETPDLNTGHSSK